MRHAAILLLALTLASCAEHHHEGRWNPNGDPNELRNRENWHSPAAALLRYDANRDGTLTRAELEAGLKAEFDRLDVKHAGCLDPGEVEAENARRQRRQERTSSPRRARRHHRPRRRGDDGPDHPERWTFSARAD